MHIGLERCFSCSVVSPPLYAKPLPNCKKQYLMDVALYPMARIASERHREPERDLWSNKQSASSIGKTARKIAYSLATELKLAKNPSLRVGQRRRSPATWLVCKSMRIQWCSISTRIPLLWLLSLGARINQQTRGRERLTHTRGEILKPCLFQLWYVLFGKSTMQLQTKRCLKL